MNELQQHVCPYGAQGGFWDSSLKCATAQTTSHQGLTVVSHQRPPKVFLCEGQGSLLTLVPCIMMDTIQCCAVLGSGNHKGQVSFPLSFKRGAYVQEPLTHDQAVLHVEKHVACSASMLSFKYFLRSVSLLWRGVSFLVRIHLQHAASTGSTSWASDQSTTCISTSLVA